MKNPFNSWKKPAIILAVAAGGAFTIAAGDNYFEVGKNLEIFNELYKNINIYYVDDVNPGELIDTGIDAMLESLDPYTQYIAESDMEDYRIMTTGQYGGIGAMIRKKDDGVMVSEPYEGYPAGSGNCSQTCGRKVERRLPALKITPSMFGRSRARASASSRKTSVSGGVSSETSTRVSGHSSALSGSKRGSRKAALRAFS